MKLKNKIFGISIVLFFFGGIFFYNNIQKINKQDGINITQKYNTGNIINSSGNTNILEEKEKLKKRTLDEIYKSNIKLSSIEKEKIIDFTINKTDKQITELLFSEGFQDYKNILTEKGKNINYTTEKISFLYLCNLYSKKGKIEFDKEFIKITFPEDVISKLNNKETYNYFYDKCMGKKVGILKGFEDENNHGCPIKVFYYYNLFNDIDIHDIYSNNIIKNNIKSKGEKIFYYFSLDILNGKKINSKICESYFDIKYD